MLVLWGFLYRLFLRMSSEGRSYLISAAGGDAMLHRFKTRYFTRLEGFWLVIFDWRET